ADSSPEWSRARARLETALCALARPARAPGFRTESAVRRPAPPRRALPARPLPAALGRYGPGVAGRDAGPEREGARLVQPAARDRDPAPPAPLLRLDRGARRG